MEDFKCQEQEAHWGRDKNVRDILIHLYEWHQLLIKFVEHNMKEESKIAFLPVEYSWVHVLVITTGLSKKLRLIVKKLSSYKNSKRINENVSGI